MEQLSGSVDHVIYYNEENGYAVIRIIGEDDRGVIAVGSLPCVGAGEELSLSGSWTQHPSYGRQFVISSAERRMPASESAMLAYLSSGNVSGIGPVTAARVIEKYSAEAFDIIENYPDKLSEVRGLTRAKAEKIRESFRRQLGIRRLMEFLVANGIPAGVAMRLYKWYGAEALRYVSDNPYILVDANFGVDFSLADTLAGRLGFASASEKRLEAGVLYELEYNSGNGHVFIPADKLSAASAQLLGVEPEACDAAIARLSEQGRVSVEQIAGLSAVYLERFCDAEKNVARRLAVMAAHPPQPPENLERLIDEVSAQSGVVFSEAQRSAIASAVCSRILLLTGGPGTGKSTSVAGMLGAFEKLGLETVLSSPTGRAAKRLSELTGKEATTIHRLLEVQFDDSGEGFSFLRCEDDPLPADVVILDETSMVDITLMSALLAALKPDARLILVGDPDQLPSVGPGNVLKDLLTCGILETAALRDIFRQAQNSNIVVNSHAVNRGEMPNLKNKEGDFFFIKRDTPETVLETVVDLCIRRLPVNMGFEPSQIQVLSPTRKGGTGTARLNAALQDALNPPAPGKHERRSGEYIFRTGDRVMHIRNNYNLQWFPTSGGAGGLGVFNGDIGEILEIDAASETMLVLYDDRIVYYPFDLLSELEPAYAMTVHKSQGSEYPAVVLVASSAASSRLLSRQVFYTAITRARKLLVIVGEEQVVSAMVANNRRGVRYSGLRSRLSQA